MKTIIRNRKSWNLNLGEVINYRELLILMAFRDIKAKFAQTFLGLSWTVIKPVFQVLVYVIVGGEIGIETDVPYPIFVMSGIIAWNYFTAITQETGGAIIASRAIVTKVYFPRLILPLSKAFVGVIELGISLVICFGLMIYYQIPIGWQIITLPGFILLNVMTSMGLGLWLSSLSIRYRDIQYLMPFMIQMLFFLTPVMYSVESEELRMLNPMVGVVEGFRWSLIGLPLEFKAFLTSVSISLTVFISGLFFFKRSESKIADII